MCFVHAERKHYPAQNSIIRPFARHLYWQTLSCHLTRKKRFPSFSKSVFRMSTRRTRTLFDTRSQREKRVRETIFCPKHPLLATGEHTTAAREVTQGHQGHLVGLVPYAYNTDVAMYHCRYRLVSSPPSSSVRSKELGLLEEIVQGC